MAHVRQWSIGEPTPACAPIRRDHREVIASCLTARSRDFTAGCSPILTSVLVRSFGQMREIACDYRDDPPDGRRRLIANDGRIGSNRDSLWAETGRM